MLVYYVEDDASISYIIGKTLEKMGVNKEGFSNGDSFIKAYENRKPDLILLDIMLPDASGIELLKYVRNNNKDIPIIVISALFDEMDKVRALDLGADDYITKPFGILELTSRIQARLRKVKKKDVIEYGDIRIDYKKHRVFSKNNEINFTNKEFDVFSFLVKKSEEVLSKEEIFHEVWDTHFMGETRALDMHIKAIRQKLVEADSSVKIETIYGIGYKLGII